MESESVRKIQSWHATERLPRVRVSAFCCLTTALLGYLVMACSATAQERFDWRSYRRSAVDLRLPADTEFEHRQTGLTEEESESYLNLLDAVDIRRQNHWQSQSSPDTAQAEWQRAFYDFATARRKAWLNGKLPLTQQLEDPFRPADESTDDVQTTNHGPDEYHVLDDIRSYPNDYVGHPVVMYGLFESAGTVELLPKITFRSGLTPQPVKLARGVLKSRINGESLAVVDTRGLLTAEKGHLDFDQWPTDKPLPVLIKGWFVKLWGQHPLIFCENLRLITENPHRDLIIQHTVPEQRLLQQESWLYYETLTQLEQSSRLQQQRKANETLRTRIDQLREEIVEKSTHDLANVDTLLAAGTISKEEAEQQRLRISRMLGQRIAKHKQHVENPASFETFVDLFQFPEAWQGKLLSMNGHVQHVVSYPADETLFGHRELHELWLFTDDSQHIPTVVVTPNLPDGFPKDAEIVDRVSVTGCFFKQYVYNSQKDKRIAPLLLAGSVKWHPTESQIQSLVASGDLDPESPLAQNVSGSESSSISRPATLLVGALAVLSMMILVGRSQRERRDRRRLLDRVNENPEFENRVPSDYSAMPELSSDDDIDSLL